MLVPGFFVAALMDAPRVFDCTVTPIPGNASLPTQIIASMPRDVQKILALDATARYIGVYKGSVGNEVLVCMIGSGTALYQDATFRAGERISIRNMDADTIVTGSLALQFLASIY